nr:MAG TPA: resistance protein [Crassvirales sp.]
MAKSIFDIDRELYVLYDEIEEAGGEITEEMKEKLELNGQEMTNKVRSITNFINKLKADLIAIKSETDRLAKLKKSKENTITGLNNLVLFAIKNYGTEDKKGKKWIDWGTGKVGVRKSESVELDDKKIENLADVLKTTIVNGIYTNTLHQSNCIDPQAILDAAIHNAQIEGEITNSEVEVEDMDDVIINVTIPVTMAKLLYGDGYSLLANMGDVAKDGWDFKPTVDKKAMKVKIKDEGCTSNIAKIVENDNLTIK